MIANDLFGKSFSEMKPLINAGSKELEKFMETAKENGLVLEEEQVKKLGEVDDAHQRLQAQIEATKNEMAVRFAPAAIQAMETFGNAIETGAKVLMDSGLIEGLGEVLQLGANLVAMGGKLIEAGQKVSSYLPSWMNPIKMLTNGFGALNDVIGGTLSLLGESKTVMKGYDGLGSNLPGAEWKSDVQAWVTKSGMIVRPDNINDFDPNTGKLKQEFYDLADSLTGYYDEYATYGSMSPGELQNYLRHNLSYDQDGKGYYTSYGGKAIYPNNAAGTRNWKGGPTWVGENGPELLDLPAGTQILSSPDSLRLAELLPYYASGAVERSISSAINNSYSSVGGSTYYVYNTIDAKSVKSFNDVVRIMESAETIRRMY